MLCEPTRFWEATLIGTACVTRWASANRDMIWHSTFSIDATCTWTWVNALVIDTC